MSTTIPEDSAEKRGASRYDAVRTSIFLGWWEGEEFRTSAATLRNLSHNGALVHVAARPAEGADLWLCLAGSPPGDWVGVTLVSAAVRPKDSYFKLRFLFPDRCPYEFFKGALHDFTPSD